MKEQCSPCYLTGFAANIANPTDVFTEPGAFRQLDGGWNSKT